MPAPHRAGTALSSAEPFTSSNTPPQLNPCFALLRCPASVPHEPTVPTSTCLPAPARTEALCRISLQPHSRRALHRCLLPHPEACPPRTLPAIRIRTTHHRPPIPAASAQHHSNPIATQLPAASFKSLYPKRPHSASIKPTEENGRSRYRTRSAESRWVHRRFASIEATAATLLLLPSRSTAGIMITGLVAGLILP